MKIENWKVCDEVVFSVLEDVGVCECYVYWDFIIIKSGEYFGVLGCLVGFMVWY